MPSHEEVVKEHAASRDYLRDEVEYMYLLGEEPDQQLIQDGTGQSDEDEDPILQLLVPKPAFVEYPQDAQDVTDRCSDNESDSRGDEIMNVKHFCQECEEPEVHGEGNVA